MIVIVVFVMIRREVVDIHQLVHWSACTVDVIFDDNHVDDDEDHDDELFVDAVVVIKQGGSKSSSCRLTHCCDAVPANQYKE